MLLRITIQYLLLRFKSCRTITLAVKMSISGTARQFNKMAECHQKLDGGLHLAPGHHFGHVCLKPSLKRI